MIEPTKFRLQQLDRQRPPHLNPEQPRHEDQKNGQGDETQDVQPPPYLSALLIFIVTTYSFHLTHLRFAIHVPP